MEADGCLIDHTKFDWKELLGPWEWLLEDDMAVSPWLVSQFGDLFFVDETGLVHWLNISDGELTEVATSEDEFMELLENDECAEEWFQLAFLDDLKTAGRTLAAGQCFGFKDLPVLGGEYEIQNVDVWSIADYWAYCGRIHLQLDGLPDGTEVDIDIPEL